MRRTKETPPRKKISPALIGKAGEALVGGELLRKGIDVAYPAYDGGIDMVAYRESDFGTVVPIQIKARSGSCYNFQKTWFRIPGIVLVQVWYVADLPEFYIFDSLERVEKALGKHAKSRSWRNNGGYSVTNPGPADRDRMRRHKNQWDRIIHKLMPAP